MNTGFSSKQVKCIKITINEAGQINFFSQLDIEKAVEILERCIKDLKKGESITK